MDITYIKMGNKHMYMTAIINSDQGSQSTRKEYTQYLQQIGIRQSMDGKARWVDNVLIERWFRNLKCECIYINEYGSPRELRRGISTYVNEYNKRTTPQPPWRRLSSRGVSESSLTSSAQKELASGGLMKLLPTIKVSLSFQKLCLDLGDTIKIIKTIKLYNREQLQNCSCSLSICGIINGNLISSIEVRVLFRWLHISDIHFDSQGDGLYSNLLRKELPDYLKEKK